MYMLLGCLEHDLDCKIAWKFVCKLDRKIDFL